MPSSSEADPPKYKAWPLGGGFIKHGHQVVLGTRDTGKLKDFVAQHQGAQTGGFADAAKFGEVVVLAVKGLVALDALNAAGGPTWRKNR